MAGFVEMLRSVVGGDNQALRGAGQRHAGPRIGIVTNNVDPENRYRVKVKFPETDDTTESFWARVPTANASGTGADSYGMFVLPEVDDEVLVHFNDGDPEHCYILGRMWNGENNSPPELNLSPMDVVESVPNNEQGGDNDFRFWKSRMGHHLTFKDREGEGGISLRSKKSNELYIDDTDGEEKIQIYDQDRQQWMEIDIPNKKITIQTDTGDIYIKAKHKIEMHCEDMIVKATKTITVESGTSSSWHAKSTLNWKSDQNSTYEAGPNMTHKATRIDLNP